MRWEEDQQSREPASYSPHREAGQRRTAKPSGQSGMRELENGVVWPNAHNSGLSSRGFCELFSRPNGNVKLRHVQTEPGPLPPGLRRGEAGSRK